MKIIFTDEQEKERFIKTLVFSFICPVEFNKNMKSFCKARGKNKRKHKKGYDEGNVKICSVCWRKAIEEMGEVQKDI